MSGYRTEEEQVELLRRLWNKYGTAVISAILLCVIAVYGFRFWQNRKLRITEEAAGVYQDLLAAVQDDKRADDVKGYIQNLEVQHKETPYAVLASLLAAKQAVDEKDYKKAAASLRWAMDNCRDKELRVIVVLRLARVLAADGRLDDSLQLLNSLNSEEFKARIQEVTGDILTLMKKQQDAMKAYRVASANYQEDTDRNMVEMKINQLESELQQGEKH